MIHEEENEEKKREKEMEALTDFESKGGDFSEL